VQFHPLADIVPLIEGAEFQTLVEDIREQGLNKSIVMYQGKVLDGRNRWRACCIIGIDKVKGFRTREYEGNDPLGHVISANVTRRHLNESQRAMVAAKLANMRQGERTDLKSANLQKVAQAAAAERLNVSVRTIASAAKVRSAGTTELITAVEQGRIAVSAAAKVATHDPDIQRSAIERVKDGSHLDTMRAVTAAVRQKRDDVAKAAFQAMGSQPVSADESAEHVMLGDRRVDIIHGSLGWRSDPTAQGWKLTIGPNVSAEVHEVRKWDVGRDAEVTKWRHRDDLINHAVGLEIAAKKANARARKLRNDADYLGKKMKQRIKQLLEREYGPAELHTDFLEFQADEASEAALAALPPDELVQRLIAVHVAQGQKWVPREQLADKPIRRVSQSSSLHMPRQEIVDELIKEEEELDAFHNEEEEEMAAYQARLEAMNEEERVEEYRTLIRNLLGDKADEFEAAIAAADPADGR
jgi:hypothetical protein